MPESTSVLYASEHCILQFIDNHIKLCSAIDANQLMLEHQMPPQYEQILVVKGELLWYPPLFQNPRKSYRSSKCHINSFPEWYRKHVSRHTKIIKHNTVISYTICAKTNNTIRAFVCAWQNNKRKETKQNEGYKNGIRNQIRIKFCQFNWAQAKWKNKFSKTSP